jgi:hypothetical protein
MATSLRTDRVVETSEDCEENEVSRFGSWRIPSREIKLRSPKKSSIHSFDGVRGPREIRVGLGPWGGHGPWGGQKRSLDCGVGWTLYPSSCVKRRTGDVSSLARYIYTVWEKSRVE